MTGVNTRTYEMFVRVANFAADHPQYFPQGSIAAQLLTVIQEVIQKLSSEAARLVTGKGEVRTWSTSRKEARQALRTELEVISRTARGMNLQGFYLPRDRGDQAWVSTGHSFVQAAEAIKMQFIERHLPQDFIEKLKAAIEKVELSINAQTTSKNMRATSAAAIDGTRNVGLEALHSLDSIMFNLFRDNQPMSVAWERARHLEKRKARKARPAPEAEPEPATQAVTSG